MSYRNAISRLSLSGFFSIRDLKEFELRPLNVLIGPNGAGKSNFIAFFRMLNEQVNCRLQKWCAQQGSADRILSHGVKETSQMASFIEFGRNGYDFVLEPTVEGGLVFARERLFFAGDIGSVWRDLGSGHMESRLKERYLLSSRGIEDWCYESIVSWKIYHFHDTGHTAGVKRWGALHDNDYLRPDASNLAAFLFRLSHTYPAIYQKILKTVQRVIPALDDFILTPRVLDSGEEQIRLLWKQKGSDYPFAPSQMSDGTLRFLCLATALLQPEPPATILIDEPELGLHPAALKILAALIRLASQRMQVIVSTQSVTLLDEFSVEDVVVVESSADGTRFFRHDEAALRQWLEEYTPGALWMKNILGGRP